MKRERNKLENKVENKFTFIFSVSFLLLYSFFAHHNDLSRRKIRKKNDTNEARQK